MRKYVVISVIFLLLMTAYFLFGWPPATKLVLQKISPTTSIQAPITSSPTHGFPLAISTLKAKSYPGSELTIEKSLSDGSNYKQYLVSYRSDGLKIYGLLTVPSGKKPAGGWPAILLNHGYIPPSQYSTIQSYTLAVVPLASHGYIVFKPDYRGNGNSEGTPTQVYISADYVTDSLNALASLKRYAEVNPEEIGVWGHSMGGNITLHDLVLRSDFKAAVLWAGVVGSYSEILDWWTNRIAAGTLQGNDADTAIVVKQFVTNHGTPQSNPRFWNSIDPISDLEDIHTPILIQVGTADQVVPSSFSAHLSERLQQARKQVTLTEYQSADHNLAPDSMEVMQAALQFFDRYLK